MPCANLAKISADAGATTSASQRCASAMCSMALSSVASAVEEPNMPVMTFCPVSAANVSGRTNSWACAVITTSTVCARSCSARASSAALYAAMPPVTPRTILIGSLRLLIGRRILFFGGGRRILRIYEGYQAAARFLNRHPRHFARLGRDFRPCARLQLACALRRHDDETIDALFRITRDCGRRLIGTGFRLHRLVFSHLSSLPRSFAKWAE